MDRRGSCVSSEQDRNVDGAILGLLLDFEAGGLWSVEELVLELGTSRIEVVDGLASLRAAGLIHRCGEFVFATRASSRFDRLEI